MTSVDRSIAEKTDRLRRVVREKKNVLVAFSGGVDSSVIAAVAHDELGDRALCVTVDTPSLSRRELELARRVAAEIGIAHRIVRIGALDPGVARNSPMRCFHCKKEEMCELRKIAADRGFTAIAFGVTLSDSREHRPGLNVLAEEGAFLPLVEARIGKEEIRPIARLLGLSNSEQPSTTCLSSRIPYGQPVTADKLEAVERAETFLYGLGLAQVRVRHYGDTARIEVDPGDMDKVLAAREQIAERFRRIGFVYVTLDLEGYRSGSMNAVLNEGGG